MVRKSTRYSAGRERSLIYSCNTGETSGLSASRIEALGVDMKDGELGLVENLRDVPKGWSENCKSVLILGSGSTWSLFLTRFDYQLSWTRAQVERNWSQGVAVCVRVFSWRCASGHTVLLAVQLVRQRNQIKDKIVVWSCFPALARDPLPVKRPWSASGGHFDERLPIVTNSPQMHAKYRSYLKKPSILRTVCSTPRARATRRYSSPPSTQGFPQISQTRKARHISYSPDIASLFFSP